MLFKKILRRLGRELSSFAQSYVPRNWKYKPKGVVNVSRVSNADQKYFEITPPHSSHLKLSPDFVEACSWYQKPPMNIDTPGDFVVALRNGRMYCTDISNFATVSQDGYVQEELSFQWGDERIDPAKDNKIFSVRGFRNPKVYKGKVFSLLSGGGAKYFIYHWVLETVPKMYLFQQTGEIDRDSYFLVPSKQHQYQREYLTHFGIDDEHIIDEEEFHHIQADWLYVASHVKFFDHHPKWSIDFLYKNIVLNPDKAPARRIYISRGDATKNRPVVNEPKLIEMLTKHGFESVELSKLTIYEKAQVFNSAAIVVAVHGGGLANLVFCEPDSMLLEIFPDEYVLHAYHDIADKRGMDYHYMLLPSLGKAKDALYGQQIGVVADVAKIEQKVLSMLKGASVPKTANVVR